MDVRNFNQDLKNSNNPALLKDWKRISNIFFPNSIFTHKEENMEIQTQFGVDALLKTEKGRRYSIELKTRREQYCNCSDYLLEIAHHIYKDKTRKERIETKPGWLYQSTADLLLFGTVNKDYTKLKEVCLFSLIPFKEEEFKQEISKLHNVWASTQFDSGRFQLTLNKVVDINFLKENSMKFMFWKEEDL